LTPLPSVMKQRLFQYAVNHHSHLSAVKATKIYPKEQSQILLLNTPLKRETKQLSSKISKHAILQIQKNSSCGLLKFYTIKSFRLMKTAAKLSKKAKQSFKVVRKRSLLKQRSYVLSFPISYF